MMVMSVTLYSCKILGQFYCTLGSSLVLCGRVSNVIYTVHYVRLSVFYSIVIPTAMPNSVSLNEK